MKEYEATIIWKLKKDSRGKKFMRVNMEGAGEYLMIGVKAIFDDLVAAMAQDWGGTQEDIRSVLTGWLSDDESVKEEAAE